MTPAQHARRRLRILGLIAVIAAIPILNAAFASGATVEPTFVAGNPSCADINPSWTELKMEPVADGTVTDGTLTATVDVTGNTFDWSTNIGVDAVIVKGGPNSNVYEYSPEATSDTGLHAPFNDNSGDWYGLSHISWCYDVEQPSESPSPSTSVSPSVTPSESPSESPSASPSPSVSPTVTVTESPSPSESASVLPTVVSQSPSPSTSVLAEQVAKTGSSQINGLLAFLGVVMILLGLTLFAISSLKLRGMES